MSAEPTKRCTGRCGRVLPYSAYTRQAANATGRTSRCRDCMAADRRDATQRRNRRRAATVDRVHVADAAFAEGFALGYLAGASTAAEVAE